MSNEDGYMKDLDRAFVRADGLRRTIQIRTKLPDGHKVASMPIKSIDGYMEDLSNAMVDSSSRKIRA